VFRPTFNKQSLGKAFKKAQEGICNFITQACTDGAKAKVIQEQLATGSIEIEVGGEKYTIAKDMVQITEVEEKQNGESINSV
jgi:hypothetical protein